MLRARADGRAMRSQHLVHDAPRLGLVGGHEVVAVGVVGDALERTARRLGEDAVSVIDSRNTQCLCRSYAQAHTMLLRIIVYNDRF